MLEIKDLKVNIEDKEILKGINLSVKVGEFKTPVGMDFNVSGKKLDITQRGVEKKLVLERSLGAMVSGRKIGDMFSYDIGVFNPTNRSSAVSSGVLGDGLAYAATDFGQP